MKRENNFQLDLLDLSSKSISIDPTLFLVPLEYAIEHALSQLQVYNISYYNFKKPILDQKGGSKFKISKNPKKVPLYFYFLFFIYSMN